MKYFLCVGLGVCLTLSVIWLLDKPPDDTEFRAIQREKETLSAKLKINEQELRKISELVIISEEENKALRHLNEANNKVLNQWRQKANDREKKLLDILTYSNAAMDSLYRAKYPQADSLKAN